MGWIDKTKKMQTKMKQAMRDRIDKIKAEQISKGLTTKEYIDAKSNGTLSSLPIVNSNQGVIPMDNNSNYTILYISVFILALGGIYLYKKKK
jgi:hypothetical protein